MTIPIPPGNHMRMRSKGRYVYAINPDQDTNGHICWSTIEPPAGATVYCVAWSNSQNRWMSTHSYVQKGTK